MQFASTQLQKDFEAAAQAAQHLHRAAVVDCQVVDAAVKQNPEALRSLKTSTTSIGDSLQFEDLAVRGVKFETMENPWAFHVAF